MIQKPLLVFTLCLTLTFINVYQTNGQTSSDPFVKNRIKNTVQLLNLWDSVNNNDVYIKDPFTIDDWEQMVLKEYNLAVSKNDKDLIFKLSLPLSYIYHSETKFKKGTPLLEFLYKQKDKLSPIRYKQVCVKLEEEYRASNNIEQVLSIRKERINNKYIDNYWEIYKDCGLYDAALKDYLQFVKIPELYSIKRLQYYFQLGELYMQMKHYDSAKIIYNTGLKEATETIIENATTNKYEKDNLIYWEACFMGFTIKSNIEMGDYSNAIPILKYDIAKSFQNSDNKITKMNALAKAYIKSNQFRDAKLYIDSVSYLLSEKTTKNLELDHLLIFSDYYANNNNDDSALYFIKKFNTYRDALNRRIEKNQSVLVLAQMEISNRRTELLESNKSLIESNKKNSEQKTILLFLLFSLVLSIIVGVIIYLNSLAKSRYTAKIKAQSVLINENSNKIEAQFNHNEILLKELHHRVKNNLQVMYSLLNLQKRRNQDEDTIETLSSIQNRIQTMALVHQNLYTSGDFEMVEIANYIKTLANHLEAIYKVDKKKIQIIFDIDEALKLPIEKVVAIGLIINEAVSNSFKYAFKNVQNGKLYIKIKSDSNETEIIIQDNGIGLGEVPQKENSLGMKLIKLMCLQLKATHSIEKINGVTHYIKFNQA
jgi:two-component sensor histidine kinase